MTHNSNASTGEMWNNVSLNSDEGEQSVVLGDAELNYEPSNSLVNPGKLLYLSVSL